MKATNVVSIQSLKVSEVWFEVFLQNILISAFVTFKLMFPIFIFFYFFSTPGIAQGRLLALYSKSTSGILGGL